MSYFDIILADDVATVVAEFKSTKRNETSYQSEKELEKQFIKQLISQGYEYLPIKSADKLKQNLRIQLEKLNKYKFTDNEWNRFSNEYIFNSKLSIKEKTDTIQLNHQKTLTLDDGSTKNIYFIDKNHIANNCVQVINQYVNNKGTYDNRYDVTILVNGLPLVHIELKRRGIAIEQAFNQIERYQRQSFWADTGLYEFVQIFVISNGTNTKYYSNTTRWNYTHNKRKQKTSNSFEFTNFWADAKNKHITDLVDFTANFFEKNRLLKILTKYCVFTYDQNLLVMRPYQIVATERIINRIQIAHNHKAYGNISAGGFIWHTTGSGKTLTSFKTSQLITQLDFIHKVLFVVDRKDLDYQTMREYDRYEKGAANSNTSTVILEKQLRDHKSKIIITTIQKLSNFIKSFKKHDVLNQEIVLIFDECHRSQFGEMHKAICDSFKKYYIFGFTGTPIFGCNTNSGIKSLNKTTEQTFGDKLHTYTIDNAIADNNVLPFRINYLSTMHKKNNIQDQEVEGIDTKAAFLNPIRIQNNVKYILDNFDRLTRRNERYSFNAIKNIIELVNSKNKTSENHLHAIKNGFNSILATTSIEAAKMYYIEFKKQNKPGSDHFKKVALIYSYGANPDEETGLFDDECSDDTLKLSSLDREFLDDAIKDYNKMFKANYDTSTKEFANYYKDVSLRMKNNEIDILIVVNMFLTGFDAATLNTLYVDKNLKQHGLIQAFSRTNRIFNSIKKYGNIICFLNLRRRVKDAIALFADKDAHSIIELLPFDCYYNGYDKDGEHRNGYLDFLNLLKTLFPLNKDIIGEENEKKFIGLFGSILRIRNILVSFDEFKDTDITERDLQDYQSRYLDLKDKYTSSGNKASLTNINEDLVFETELIAQEDYGVDAILSKVKELHNLHTEDKVITTTIMRMVESSPTLRSKKALIEQFLIKNLEDLDDIVSYYKEWTSHVTMNYHEEIKKLIQKYNLKEKETFLFIEECLINGFVKTTGTDITKILPIISRFDSDNKRDAIKEKVIREIFSIVNKYNDSLVSLPTNNQ